MKQMNYKTRQKALWDMFLIPGLYFLGCFLVFPFFKSLVRSFTDWNAFSPDFSFVGLKTTLSCFIMTNIAAIKVNLVFAVVSTLIQTTLGFLLAFAVYYMTPKWRSFKVALYPGRPPRFCSGGYVEVYAEQGYWSGQYAAAPGWS